MTHDLAAVSTAVTNDPLVSISISTHQAISHPHTHTPTHPHTHTPTHPHTHTVSQRVQSHTPRADGTTAPRARSPYVLLCTRLRHRPVRPEGAVCLSKGPAAYSACSKLLGAVT